MDFYLKHNIIDWNCYPKNLNIASMLSRRDSWYWTLVTVKMEYSNDTWRIYILVCIYHHRKKSKRKDYLNEQQVRCKGWLTWLGRTISDSMGGSWGKGMRYRGTIKQTTLTNNKKINSCTQNTTTSTEDRAHRTIKSSTLNSYKYKIGRYLLLKFLSWHIFNVKTAIPTCISQISRRSIYFGAGRINYVINFKRHGNTVT